MTRLEKRMQVELHFVPEPYRLAPADFEALKTMIATREAQKPGSVSLEEIRNFSVPNPSNQPAP
jgi:hypothetical protein